MGEKIVLKLGGSILTRKDAKVFPLSIEEIKRRADEYIRIENVKRLAKEIYEVLREKKIELVLINGVGPFGHNLVKNWDKLGYKTLVHDSVKYLNDKLIKIVGEYGLEMEPFAPFDSRGIDETYSVYKLWDMGKKIIGRDKIFSTYGDIAPDNNEQGYRVVSGDELVRDIANIWEADKIIMATNVEGVYDKDPHEHKNAKLIKRFHVTENVEFADGRTTDVTGAMREKVEKLLEVKANSQIISGLIPDNLKSVMLGDESIGTLILT